jgi:hypothetical protein
LKKEAKTYFGEKITFSKNGVEKTGYLYGED